MSGQVIHRKGDLFEALKEPNPILVHACNVIGAWGAGVAQEFRDRFPAAFKKYEVECTTSLNPVDLIGTYGRWISPDSNNQVAWLFTAVYPGRQPKPEQVARDTGNAIFNLLRVVDNPNPPFSFHSPRMNAGLFGVTWRLTESAIQQALIDSGRPFDWNVWTL